MASNPYNALMNPAQIGQGVQNAFSAGRETAREEKFTNALADYASGTGDLGAIMRLNPQLGMELQQQQRQQQAQVSEEQRKQALQMARLLNDVTDEQSYQQAKAAAQYLKMDVSGAPANYDPNWVGMQKRIVASYLDDNDDNLPTLAKEFQAGGVDLKTPEGRAAYLRALEGRYGTEYIDQEGQTRRRAVFQTGGQAGGGPQPGTVEDGFRFKGGNPADRNSWEPVQPGMTNAQGGAALGQAARTNTISQQEAARVRQSLGPNGQAAFEQWLRQNNIVIGGQ